MISVFIAVTEAASFPMEAANVSAFLGQSSSSETFSIVVKKSALEKEVLYDPCSSSEPIEATMSL